MPNGRSSNAKHELSDYASVVKDHPDLRDLFYQPTLRPLASSSEVPRALLSGLLPVRNQLVFKPGEDEGTCTAQALANVIDILRFENSTSLNASGGSHYECVAPAMLYDHGQAIEYSESGTTEEGLRSLRTAIKGFYHNGVCSDKIWRNIGTTDQDRQRNLIDRYREARETPLGSYYRLQPILNDYHAALNEVSVIYAAAAIHDGWALQSVTDNGGEIKLPENNAPGFVRGHHAFAIIGYTPKGFLVLNSWGDDWGNYKVASPNAVAGEAAGGAAPVTLPGVALWTYQDWAERLIDGWVLRLGVSAPDAFRFSFGRQGVGDLLAGERTVGSTPRHELIGHYIHADDGKIVTKGAIPTDRASLEATRLRLEDRQAPDGERGLMEKRYKGVLLWLAGGSGGTKDILSYIAKTKDHWKKKKIYPITALWCSDLMDQASAFLDRIEQGAFELVRTVGLDLDRRIEQDVRPIGRAVWRDIAASADKAAGKDQCGNKGKDPEAGAILEAYDIFAKTKETEMHLVAEGVGAILMHRLVINFSPEQFIRINSITLVMPACTVDEFKEMEWRLAKWGKSINLIVASEATSRRFRFGRYRGSLLDLAQMAFVEDPPKRSAPPKASKSSPGEKSKRSNAAQAPRILEAVSSSNLVGTHTKAAVIKLLGVPSDRVIEIGVPGGETSFTTLRDVSAGQEAMNAIEKIILGEKAKGDAPPYSAVPEPTRAEQVRTSAKSGIASGPMSMKV